MIDPGTRMGAVELTVADLDRSLGYWQRQVGLDVRARENGRAELGTDETVVTLVEQPGAEPADGFTGLYHVALLVPDRPSLARWLAHAARDRVALTGLSDHDVSEAIYMRDPDHHGIEIYADRPRERWQGQVAQRMTTIPLDVDDLLGELDDPAAEPFDGLPEGTRVGHVHLRVADVDETVRFYRDVLGFDLMAQLGPAAAFLAAGGYHHHLGANTWQSRGAPYAPEDRARVTRTTIIVPDDAAVDAAAALEGAARTAEGVVLHDPAGNPLLVTR